MLLPGPPSFYFSLPHQNVCPKRQKAFGGGCLLLPPVSGTLGLVPNSCSENKQEAAFLPGGHVGRLHGGEIFKERERQGKESQQRRVTHSGTLCSPQALIAKSLACFRDSQCGWPR